MEEKDKYRYLKLDRYVRALFDHKLAFFTSFQLTFYISLLMCLFIYLFFAMGL